MLRITTCATGTLYLLPVPLGASAPDSVLPQSTIDRARRLSHFIVEDAKSARAILKSIDHPSLLREIHMSELNEHTPSGAIKIFLQPLREGYDVGLMSEAGCPAVADPGSRLVELAHAEGIRVKPLVGPSSILLALMASGMNGQNFTFNGYLPIKEMERLAALRRLESESRRNKGVAIFIETPYRNESMLDSLLQLRPDTRLCVACDLSLASESVRSASIQAWAKMRSVESLDRRPAVFLLQAK